MLYLILNKPKDKKGWKMVALFKDLPPSDVLTDKYGVHTVEHLDTDFDSTTHPAQF